MTSFNDTSYTMVPFYLDADNIRIKVQDSLESKPREISLLEFLKTDHEELFESLYDTKQQRWKELQTEEVSDIILTYEEKVLLADHKPIQGEIDGVKFEIRMGPYGNWNGYMFPRRNDFFLIKGKMIPATEISCVSNYGGYIPYGGFTAVWGFDTTTHHDDFELSDLTYLIDGNASVAKKIYKTKQFVLGELLKTIISYKSQICVQEPVGAGGGASASAEQRSRDEEEQ